ncbi:hypothetical protein [Roseococcus sp.]|uniref:hypothetical protein n=1 Tax=Roseococcus sp. TaxID=2109646 RepID=UPI003BA96399
MDVLDVMAIVSLAGPIHVPIGLAATLPEALGQSKGDTPSASGRAPSAARRARGPPTETFRNLPRSYAKHWQEAAC